MTQEKLRKVKKLEWGKLNRKVHFDFVLLIAFYFTIRCKIFSILKLSVMVETIFYKMRYSLSLLFLIAVISISSVINDILQGSIVTLKHGCKKSEIKRSKCPINYYANSAASTN